MAKILMTWELGGGLGHCMKLAPIAARLLEYGHEVCFAAADVATARSVFEGMAVRLLPTPKPAHGPLQPIRRPGNFAQILYNVGFETKDQLAALVGEWRHVIESVEPDAVLCEHSPRVLLASRWHSLKRIVIGTGFSVPPDTTPFPALRQAPVDEEVLLRDELQLLERINSLLRADGLNTLGRVGQLYGDANSQFLMTFCELDHYPTRGTATYWGTFSPSSGSVPEWPPGSGPKVFGYLKPSAGAWRLESVLQILSRLEARSIVYVGSRAAEFRGFQSKNLRLSESRVDVDALSLDCDAAILHGTAGTTTQLLLAGVPLLLLPLNLEQGILSQRVTAMGAGAMVNPRSADQLASKLQLLFHNGQFRHKAESFAAKYAGFSPIRVSQQISAQIDALLR